MTTRQVVGAKEDGVVEEVHERKTERETTKERL